MAQFTPADGRRRVGAQIRVSRERCIEAVAAYAAEAARQGRDPGLVGYERAAADRRWPSRTTVTARLGPWSAALRAAGRPARERQAAAGDCLAAVSRYLAEMAAASRYPGLRGYRALAPHRGWPAAATVAGRLGSWATALQRAGFSGPPRAGRRNVSREECIAAVKAYVDEAMVAGRHPGVAGYDALHRERGWPQRQSTVMARLGSWSAALSAAGYPDGRHQRRHRVSRSECVAAVRSYLAEVAAGGQAPSLAGYGALARDHGWPAVATVLARLGSWREAVALARATGPDCAAPTRNARDLVSASGHTHEMSWRR